ncbi:MAG: aminotransferase class I/II-fold pyridoxal phosphate-dependent enzyme, partial [Gemmatimonadales bacterium]
MADVTRKLGLSTTAIHGGTPSPAAGSPVAPPLVQSVNFAQEPGTSEGLLYTRYGNTPNAERLQRRLALLEGSEAALVLSSGMGATACSMLALVRSGDHLISSSWIYGGTRKLFTEELPGMGIEVSFVNPLEPRGWRKALKKNTRAIFLESPVNPTCRVLEIGSLQNLAHAEGIALVVDSTFASPVNFRPI